MEYIDFAIAVRCHADGEWHQAEIIQSDESVELIQFAARISSKLSD